MKYVDQLKPLYVCHRASDFNQELFANHGESLIRGWVYGDESGSIAMLCEAPHGLRLIPFDPQDICCIGRSGSDLPHESGVR